MNVDALHLSARLTAVAQQVPADARLADIGSDHAYLPAALVLQGKISFAIAGEVVKGPYENAVHEIRKHNLTTSIQPRLADGLAAITPADRIDTVTIAGMGGSLIAEILERGQEQLAGINRLILQPNVGEKRLRQWLLDHRYQIMAEQIVAEDGHIYEIIVAEPSVVPFNYSDYELTFGPLLLETKSTVFKQKWQEYFQREAQVLKQMSSAKQPPHDKIAALKAKLAEVKEVIDNDYRYPNN